MKAIVMLNEVKHLTATQCDSMRCFTSFNMTMIVDVLAVYIR